MKYIGTNDDPSIHK